MRLAMLYALLDCSDQVRPDHLAAALALWDYCEASACYIFGNALGDPVADELLRALQNAGERGMTRTEIRDLFRRHKGPQQINRALDLLHGHGLARFQTEPTEGRSAERWFGMSQTATKATEAT